MEIDVEDPHRVRGGTTRSTSERRMTAASARFPSALKHPREGGNLAAVMFRHAGVQQDRLLLWSCQQALQLFAPRADAGEILFTARELGPGRVLLAARAARTPRVM